jgi:hypothetical protein
MISSLLEIESELLKDPTSWKFTPKVLDSEHYRTLSMDGYVVIWAVEAFSMLLRAALTNINSFHLVGCEEFPYDYLVACAGQFNWRFSEEGREAFERAKFCFSKSPLVTHQHPNTPCRAYGAYKRFDSSDPEGRAAAYCATLFNMQAFVSSMS